MAKLGKKVKERAKHLVEKKKDARRKRIIVSNFSKKSLIKDILKEAKVLNIPEGSAEKFAEKAAEKVEKWVSKRTEITYDDLDRITAVELEKYHPDLAYVFKNRRKII